VISDWMKERMAGQEWLGSCRAAGTAQRGRFALPGDGKNGTDGTYGTNGGRTEERLTPRIASFHEGSIRLGSQAGM